MTDDIILNKQNIKENELVLLFLNKMYMKMNLATTEIEVAV